MSIPAGKTERQVNTARSRNVFMFVDPFNDFGQVIDDRSVIVHSERCGLVQVCKYRTYKIKYNSLLYTRFDTLCLRRPIFTPACFSSP